MNGSILLSPRTESLRMGNFQLHLISGADDISWVDSRSTDSGLLILNYKFQPRITPMRP